MVIRNFPWHRRLWERIQSLVTGDDWPVRVAGRFAGETVQVVHEEVTLPKALGTARSLRVGFAADLHAGPTTPLVLIEKACRALQDAGPDVILLGGDFASLRSRDLPRLIGPLSQLSAPQGVFAVLGNHDHWVGAEHVSAILQESGIILLDNRSRFLSPPFDRTLVVGLDDHLSGWPDASAAEWDASAATILLLHQPSGLLDAPGRPFDVALAGHTHAGQIVLPGGWALVVPEGALSRRYRVGRHVLEAGETLLVTRGVGNSVLPLRIGSPSEVVICTVTGARVP